LLGLMLVYFASNGLLTNSLQLFYPLLTEEFGWDTETVTRPAKYMFIVGALTSPLAGILLDRYSSRHLMVVGLVGIVIGLFFLSKIQSHTQMVIIYITFACGLSLGGKLHHRTLRLASGYVGRFSSGRSINDHSNDFSGKKPTFRSGAEN